MNKIIGYILAMLGLLGIVIYTIPEVADFAALPAQLTGTTLLIVSIVLLVVGIFFIKRSGGKRGKQETEVPIYKGKNVVGYRRH